MKPIVRLTQKPHTLKNGTIKEFKPIIIYYDENSKFPFKADRWGTPNIENDNWCEKSKNLKTLIKRMNTYHFYITEMRGKWLTDKTIGSNIEILDNTFKNEVL